MALKLAGEEYSVVQGLDEQGWVKEIFREEQPSLKVKRSTLGSVFGLEIAGNTVLYVNSYALYMGTALNMGGYAISNADELAGRTNNHLLLRPGGAAKSVIAKALPGQTAEIFAIHDATGNILAGVWTSGRIVVVLDDFQTQAAGKGIIVRTPDGTKDYRIRVDNAGAVATEQVT